MTDELFRYTDLDDDWIAVRADGTIGGNGGFTDDLGTLVVDPDEEFPAVSVIECGRYLACVYHDDPEALIAEIKGWVTRAKAEPEPEPEPISDQTLIGIWICARIGPNAEPIGHEIEKLPLESTKRVAIAYVWGVLGRSAAGDLANYLERL